MIEIIIIDGLSFALPLFIMAVGGIYSEKSGITNLALEGFQGVGAFCGSLAFVFFNLAGINSGISYYSAFLFALIGGGIFALLHALLCIKFKANQIISGVVMNILAAVMTSFITKNINASFFGNASNKITLGASEKININLFGKVYEIYSFEILIIIIAIFMYYILYKTVFGLRLRACGDNPHSACPSADAADAAGINVNLVRTFAVFISGCLSGLAGMSFAFSITSGFSPDIFLGYGYLSIAALIFGNWTILPALAACLIFGLAKSTGSVIINYLGLPSSYNDLVRIFPYVLTMILLIFFSKHNHAPKALGEIYDRAKR